MTTDREKALRDALELGDCPDEGCPQYGTSHSHTPASETAPASAAPIELNYTNWRGETATRTISPRSVRYGSTEWHPEPQWLLLAFDHDKQADREFALGDFGGMPGLNIAPASAPSCCGWEEAAKIVQNHPRISFDEDADAIAAEIRARAQPCRCGELRETLEPFLAACPAPQSGVPDDHLCYVTAGDLRRLAAPAPRSGESK